MGVVQWWTMGACTKYVRIKEGGGDSDLLQSLGINERYKKGGRGVKNIEIFPTYFAYACIIGAQFSCIFISKIDFDGILENQTTRCQERNPYHTNCTPTPESVLTKFPSTRKASSILYSEHLIMKIRLV